MRANDGGMGEAEGAKGEVLKRGIHTKGSWCRVRPRLYGNQEEKQRKRR